jgi:hypothetical protein
MSRSIWDIGLPARLAPSGRRATPIDRRRDQPRVTSFAHALLGKCLLVLGIEPARSDRPAGLSPLEAELLGSGRGRRHQGFPSASAPTADPGDPMLPESATRRQATAAMPQVDHRRRRSTRGAETWRTAHGRCLHRTHALLRALGADGLSPVRAHGDAALSRTEVARSSNLGWAKDKPSTTGEDCPLSVRRARLTPQRRECAAKSGGKRALSPVKPTGNVPKLTMTLCRSRGGYGGG